MKTLLNILTGYISDTDQWGIYAELVDGRFQPDSIAEFGSIRREDSSSRLAYFMSNKTAIQELNNTIKTDTYTDLLESPRLTDAAQSLIVHVNKTRRPAGLTVK